MYNRYVIPGMTTQETLKIARKHAQENFQLPHQIKARYLALKRFLNCISPRENIYLLAWITFPGKDQKPARDLYIKHANQKTSMPEIRRLANLIHAQKPHPILNQL